MTKAELDTLQSFIDEFEMTVNSGMNDAGAKETLYDLVNQAYVLYGDIIPQIAEQRDEIIEFHGLLYRDSKAILALLKKHLAVESNKFVVGIMPITYEKLSICPQAQSTFKDGITMYREKTYGREILDCMRLSLELLVKQILGNDKSLENQISQLGDLLENYHREFKNLIIKTIDYLCKYQNNYVKHNNAFKNEEINFIIEQTCSVINFLTDIEEQLSLGDQTSNE